MLLGYRRNRRAIPHNSGDLLKRDLFILWLVFTAWLFHWCSYVLQSCHMTALNVLTFENCPSDRGEILSGLSIHRYCNQPVLWIFSSLSSQALLWVLPPPPPPQKCLSRQTRHFHAWKLTQHALSSYDVHMIKTLCSVITLFNNLNFSCLKLSSIRYAWLCL